jgi:PAS domain S-box-containing protein
MAGSLRVLIIEDSIDDTFFLVRELQRAGFSVAFERAETSMAMQAALEARSWDLIISDYSMPRFSGSAALALYQKSRLDIPFIIGSGAMGEDRAVEMVKAGAHNYVLKDNLSRLGPAVQQELRAARDRQIRQQTEGATAFLASIVQSCDDAIVGKTLEGAVVSWNPGAERLYGYKAVEMLGRSVSILIPSARSAELRDILGKLKRGEHVEHFETVRLRKDGTPLQVSLTISPIKDPAGRIIGASSVARDITERKQQEREHLTLIRELTTALSHAQP